jgi:hypothetical protein
MNYESRVNELKTATGADVLLHEYSLSADRHKFSVSFLNDGGFAFNAPPCITDDEAFAYALDKITEWKNAES